MRLGALFIRATFSRGFSTQKPTGDILIRGLIDRSGSMSPWRSRVVAGVNAYLETLKADAKAKDAMIEIYTFDSLGTDVLRKSKGEDIELLEPREFVPRALTPLFDAVGIALQDPANETPKRLLFIFTDGEENSSKSQSQASIRNLIERRQAQGWVILYLGANVDAWQQAQKIGIPKEKALNVHVQGVNQVGEPVTTALLAAATVGLLAIGGNRLLAGFSEEHRNGAMGVTSYWQEAVSQDVRCFEEPFNSVLDLSRDLQQQVLVALLCVVLIGHIAETQKKITSHK